MLVDPGGSDQISTARNNAQTSEISGLTRSGEQNSGKFSDTKFSKMEQRESKGHRYFPPPPVDEVKEKKPKAIALSIQRSLDFLD